jgi:hypothetical protein
VRRVGKFVLMGHDCGIYAAVLKGEILLHEWEGHEHGLRLMLYSLLRNLRYERLLVGISDEMVVWDGWKDVVWSLDGVVVLVL